MASWRDFFTTGNNNDALPDWMSQNVGTAAAQVIRYPVDPGSDYYSSGHQNQPHAQEHLADGHQSNYRVYRDAYADNGSREFTMEVLRLPICCEGCVEKVKSHLIDIDGVRAVRVDQAQKMVTVSGTPDIKEILNACKKIFKRSKWQPA